jgi:hypothetical protein
MNLIGSYISFIPTFQNTISKKKKNSKNGKNYSTIKWKHYDESWICKDDVSLLCR